MEQCDGHGQPVADSMTQRFNPPPNWPTPPRGWNPPAGWAPDPAWGPPPPGWQFWVSGESQNQPATGPVRGGSPRVRGQSRVFISYRRSDCQPQANGLHDGLSHRLSSAKIFMDIESIPPGVDFEQHIRQEIEVCDVVLVLIGDNWLDRRPGSDVRRIDEPGDFVRLEIENALATATVRVVPVLVEGARMPEPIELPFSIRPLARLNAIELSDQRWAADLERLTATVETIFREQRELARAQSRSGTGNEAAWRTPVLGWVMIAVPVLTVGLANFAPAVWAAVQRRQDRRLLRGLIGYAVVIGVLPYLGLWMVTTSSTSSPASVVGLLLWLLSIALATVVAAITRKSPRSPLG